jgi:hypothetical protein
MYLTPWWPTSASSPIVTEGLIGLSHFSTATLVAGGLGRRAENRKRTSAAAHPQMCETSSQPRMTTMITIPDEVLNDLAKAGGYPRRGLSYGTKSLLLIADVKPTQSVAIATDHARGSQLWANWNPLAASLRNPCSA